MRSGSGASTGNKSIYKCYCWSSIAIIRCCWCNPDWRCRTIDRRCLCGAGDDWRSYILNDYRSGTCSCVAAGICGCPGAGMCSRSGTATSYKGIRKRYYRRNGTASIRCRRRYKNWGSRTIDRGRLWSAGNGRRRYILDDYRLGTSSCIAADISCCPDSSNDPRDAAGWGKHIGVGDGHRSAGIGSRCGARGCWGGRISALDNGVSWARDNGRRVVLHRVNLRGGSHRAIRAGDRNAEFSRDTRCQLAHQTGVRLPAAPLIRIRPSPCGNCAYLYEATIVKVFHLQLHSARHR
jgi:hypothetical protein